MFVKRAPVLCFVMIMFSLFFPLWTDDARATDQEGRSSGSPGNRLLLTGSSTMCPLIAEVGKRFQSLHHDVQVDVQCGGSERGIKDIREGKADIGMVSRALSDREKDLYGFPLARDGVSIIVQKNNPVKALSNADVAAIFTRRITNWKEVGGPNEPITVLLREKQKNATELFMKYYNLKETEVKGKLLIGDNPVTIQEMRSSHYAIAYISSGHAAREAASGVPIKILPLNNVMPTSRNIITGNYPISRALSLVTSKLPTGLAKEFIDFSLSSSVVDLIVKFDFVPYED
jgi:phosphate transport system substrate-binding protein